MGEPLLDPIFKNYHAIKRNTDQAGPWHIGGGAGIGRGPSVRGIRKSLCGQEWIDAYPTWNRLTKWITHGQPNPTVCPECLYEVIKREA